MDVRKYARNGPTAYLSRKIVDSTIRLEKAICGHSLFEAFKQFSVRPALSHREIKTTKRLRNEVFAKDKKWEPDNQAGEETDHHDPEANHLVLMRKGEAVGCVRFVPGRKNNRLRRLPMMDYGMEQIRPGALDRIARTNKNFAEISRLCILREHRGCALPEAGPEGPKNGPIKEFIFRKAKGLLSKAFRSAGLVTLNMGVKAYAELSGTEYMLATVKQDLLNSLKAQGARPEIIGEGIEHHGTRYPIKMTTDNIHMPFFVYPLYVLTRQKMARAFLEAGILDPNPNKTIHRETVRTPSRLARFFSQKNWGREIDPQPTGFMNTQWGRAFPG